MYETEFDLEEYKAELELEEKENYIRYLKHEREKAIVLVLIGLLMIITYIPVIVFFY